MEIFTHSKRDASGVRNLTISNIIIRNRWLFKPEQIKAFECLGSYNRLINAHRIISIYHQEDIRPNELAHRFDPYNVLLKTWLSNLDLYTIKTAIQVALNAAQKFRQIKAQINSTSINLAGICGPAYHFPKRLTEALATQVP